MLPGFTGCWFVDFEFQQLAGEMPSPICMVARELFTGTRIELFGDELTSRKAPPYPLDQSSLFVAYTATAELTCHAALGWPMPERLVDLQPEFRIATNGTYLPLGSGLVGALGYFGLPVIDAAYKEAMRERAQVGWPFSVAERTEMLRYCGGDVDALYSLFQTMYPQLDMPRALLRGRYVKALTKVELRGLPIDCPTLELLRQNSGPIRRRLIETVDAPYGFYRGESFVEKRFEDWLRKQGIRWPRLESGQLQVDDDTFKSMSGVHPAIAQTRELRRTMTVLRNFGLVTGHDGRSRPSMIPWQSKTGRNQPHAREFIFCYSKCLRGLVKPGRGRALIYLDWAQQEPGIAAALSGDELMKAAYATGDYYLAFAKLAGAVPADGTGKTHPVERAMYKQCGMAVQYCRGERGLAMDLNQPPVYARVLLGHHKRIFHRYWQWSDQVVDHAIRHGRLQSSFGWAIHVGERFNERTIRNFLMQSNGSEMMRLALILADERGLQVCAIVHDAFVVEAGIEDVAEVQAAMKECMAEASRIVLDGFELRTDAEQFIYPDRFMDKDGKAMWERLLQMLNP